MDINVNLSPTLSPVQTSQNGIDQYKLERPDDIPALQMDLVQTKHNLRDSLNLNLMVASPHAETSGDVANPNSPSSSENHAIDMSYSFQPTLSTITEKVIMPNHIKKEHVIVSSVVFALILIGIIVGSLVPLMSSSGEAKENFALDSDGTDKIDQRAFGFRSFILLIYALINGTLLLMPYAIWYSKSCKISMFSQKEKPVAERTLYYSYSIAEGFAKDIATMGFGVSNMMYSLVVVYRFEYLEHHGFVMKDSNISEEEIERKFYRRGAIVAMLILGLLSRVAASGVATFTVKKKSKIAHYICAAMAFLLIGIYMIIETTCVDPYSPEKLRSYDQNQICIRTMMTCFYCLMAVCAVLFSRCGLYLFSSAAEVLGMVASEVYLLTYFSTFMVYDTVDQYYDFRVH